MDPVVVSVFLFVYVGMIVGEIPRLRVDRTGFALLGAIALVASGRMTTATAWAAVDVPTLALLFGLMVISAQFRLGGFYAAVTRRLGASQHSPSGLLALVIVAAGGLSAVLANDIVCLAMAPVLIEVCVRRGLDPVPFLLALACAANVGSAATLIGNPQNMLIGQTLQLSFARYLIEGGVPAVLGLGVVWLVIALAYRSAWARPATPLESDPVAFNRWQTNKGLIVMTGVMAAFLFAPWPREVVALAGAGVLMISRRTASRELLSMVDWHLLILFIGLFVVNAAIAQSGLLSGVLMAVRQAGGDLTDPCATVRGQRRAVERGVQRAGGDAAPAGGAQRARRAGAGPCRRRSPGTCSSSAASPTSSSSIRRAGSGCRSTGGRIAESACR